MITKQSGSVHKYCSTTWLPPYISLSVSLCLYLSLYLALLPNRYINISLGTVDLSSFRLAYPLSRTLNTLSLVCFSCLSSLILSTYVYIVCFCLYVCVLCVYKYIMRDNTNYSYFSLPSLLVLNLHFSVYTNSMQFFSSFPLLSLPKLCCCCCGCCYWRHRCTFNCCCCYSSYCWCYSSPSCC